ncbi:MAG: PHB depolymerase family esterase [Chitinophagales bacterium]
MKTITLFLSLLCASVLAAQTDSFLCDGIYRSFIVHLPTGYSALNSYPLVLNLHGYTSDGSQQQFYSRMDNVADTAKFINVYPYGTLNAGSRYWNSWGVGVDDVKFLSTLIDTMMRRYTIDANRVYSCGLSNGGYMSYTLACQLQDRLAAIASVAGTMSNNTVANCLMHRRFPVMHIHGTTDPTVNYNTGAANSIGVEAVLQFWRDTNACAGPADTIAVPNTSTTDLCTAQRIQANGCAGGGDVLFYKITGGGHTWPNGVIDIPPYGNTNRDFDASVEIWKFFRGHKRLNTGLNDISLPVVAVYPNPAEGLLQVSGARPLGMVSVYDISGRLMLQQEAGDAFSKTLDVGGLQPGVYLLTTKAQTLRFTKL